MIAKVGEHVTVNLRDGGRRSVVGPYWIAPRGQKDKQSRSPWADVRTPRDRSVEKKSQLKRHAPIGTHALNLIFLSRKHSIDSCTRYRQHDENQMDISVSHYRCASVGVFTCR
ncbi:hypothetical protein TNCV_1893041 [Trichonephila clavipes]|nr:hypothetical protein TNCV_1893041 [Trichonephila clavipes]